MRFNNLIILFVLILAGVSIPIFFRTEVTTKNAQLNNDYSNMLITATEDAMQVATSDSTYKYVFADESKRQEAVDVFYDTLIQDFNYEYSTYADMVKYYVPCIFLIDTDGYYIEYTKTYTDNSGKQVYTEIITPINKWSKTFSVGGNGLTGKTYTVEFHLDDTVKVSYKNRNDHIESVEGNYKDVYEKIGKPTELNGVLDTEKNFNDQKTDLIINELYNKLEYYINYHDESFNQFNNAQYEFTLPVITGEDWARLIDNPTIISFLQGVQSQYDNNYLNIYALAGSEVEKSLYYYIKEDNGTLYYHRDFCSTITEDDKEHSYSMEQAAKHGAFPCPKCVR